MRLRRRRTLEPVPTSAMPPADGAAPCLDAASRRWPAQPVAGRFVDWATAEHYAGFGAGFCGVWHSADPLTPLDRFAIGPEGVVRARLRRRADPGAAGDRAGLANPRRRARACAGRLGAGRVVGGARGRAARAVRHGGVGAPARGGGGVIDSAGVSLRPLLRHLEHHPDAPRLEEPGASAFVSQALRPFLIAAVADRDVRRPTVVVAGDDRAARDLAADLRAWLRPRPVRFYPSRGVVYESHLAPPPHLVGLRVAALDSILDPSPGAEAPVVVVSAVALSEKVPDPALRPHGFTLRTGDL